MYDTLLNTVQRYVQKSDDLLSKSMFVESLACANILQLISLGAPNV